jgi:hypothetical protein
VNEADDESQTEGLQVRRLGIRDDQRFDVRWGTACIAERLATTRTVRGREVATAIVTGIVVDRRTAPLFG